ncbi:SRPBCC family protein [Mucilaginibacter ginkgonis]|uniref:SRPBCC domain-containing protein n=1 Tax=Mucilaginibacter ginkgonis TaxID=2682091 RepID=A0A6I4HZR6_9SPHI|nr:SRPBCC domain-containing protein [Mucilaginibacter ginkgonis]QQL49598.1 SRPBCC domain-containing protein [Mucilaginibacter ginkgonis]
MEAQPFVIEHTMDAPADKVWEAITDKDEMKQWYFDLAEFKPEVGYKFEFTGGSEDKTYLHKCEVLEVERGAKLSHTWTYDGYSGYSIVSWLLTPYGKATRVKLIHTGLETFPKEKDFARESFSQGWNYIVGKSLPDFLEKAG